MKPKIHTTEVVSLALIVGIGFTLLYGFSLGLSLFVLLLGIALLFLCFYVSKKNRFHVLVLAIICFGVSMGSFRAASTLELNKTELSKHIESKVSFEGKVVEYPDVRTGFTFLTIGDITLSTGEKPREKILVRAPLYPEFEYGQVVRVEGKLQKPYNKINGEDEYSRFSYPNFLARSDIYSTVSFADVALVGEGEGSLTRGLYASKDSLLEVIHQNIREPEAGLLEGILFGIKKALPSETIDQFISSGLVHIIVLSGYNVAIILVWVSALLGFIPLRIRYYFMYLAIGVFVLFVGAPATALRAGVMAGLAIFARQTGRSADAVTILALAVACLSIYEPRILVYDTSFQLSVLATFGIIAFTPIAESIFIKIKNKILREVLATTLATQVAVIPFMLWYMGKVSALSFFANILVVPIIPFVMLLGILVIMLGSIYTPLALPVALLCTGLLSIILLVAEKLSELPFAIYNHSIGTPTLLVLYLIIFILYLKKKKVQDFFEVRIGKQ